MQIYRKARIVARTFVEQLNILFRMGQELEGKVDANTEEIDTKQDKLISGTNIKTINNQSILGSGDLELDVDVSWGEITGDIDNQTDLKNELDTKANTSDLSTVATTGDYDDLINKPTIPAAQVNSDWNAVSGVAQILNKPSIPNPQIQSDWTQTDNTAVDYIKNKPVIPSGTVLYSGTGQNTDGAMTQKATTDELSLKVNHITSPYKLYGTNNASADIGYDIDDSTSPYTIPRRVDGGVIRVGTPINDTDAANKKYVADELTIKQDVLISGNNIKTINGTSILGSGNIAVAGQPGLTDVRLYYATGSTPPEFIPSEDYQEVSYIHMNGTNAAEIDYYPAMDDTLIFKGCVDNGYTTDETYYGVFTTPGRVMLNPFANTYEFFISDKSWRGGSVIYDIIQEYEVELSTTPTLKIDGVLTATLQSITSFTASDKLWVGRMGGTSQYLNGKFAGFKVIRNNVTIVNIKPVVRLSDNKTGIYDVISGKFYVCGDDTYGTTITGEWVTVAPQVTSQAPNLYLVKTNNNSGTITATQPSIIEKYVGVTDNTTYYTLNI